MPKLSLPLLALLLLGTLHHANAQKDEQAVKLVINKFFEGMEKRDTALVKSTCTSAPVFQTFMRDSDGKLKIFTEDYAEFLRFIGTPGKDTYEEKIKFDDIRMEAELASVWAPYTFWVNGKISHCGTDAFQLVKTPEGWKIQYILDTRRKQDCR